LFFKYGIKYNIFDNLEQTFLPRRKGDPHMSEETKKLLLDLIETLNEDQMAYAHRLLSNLFGAPQSVSDAKL
jgi:hypothetical protein